MKTITLALAVLFSSSLYAKCTVRTYVDPAYSKKVHKTVNKVLKQKRYKLLSFQAPEFEAYRLNVTYPGYTAEREVTETVHVYFQEFTGPNFETIFEMWNPTYGQDKDALALSYLKDIPSCPGRAAY